MLRELGLGLPAVRAVVDGTTDRAAALREHRERLLVERDRLDRLAETVARTIEDLEGGEEMTEDQLFEGFDPERQKAYERELVEEWGVAAGRARPLVGRRARPWGPRGSRPTRLSGPRSSRRSSGLMTAGAAADDERVLDLLVGHWELTGRYWGRPPSAEAYAGLGVDVRRAPGVQGALRRDGARFRGLAERRGDGLRPGPAHLTRTRLTRTRLTRDALPGRRRSRPGRPRPGPAGARRPYRVDQGRIVARLS